MPAPKGNKYAKGNRGGGRLSEYKKEYAAQAKRLCMLGLTDKELADFFEVTEPTINRWKKDYKEFNLSLKNGKVVADAKVAESLFKRATGFSHSSVKIFNDNGRPLKVPFVERFPPDTTAGIFWLKNRRRTGWKDKHDVGLENPDGTPIKQVIIINGREIEF